MKEISFTKGLRKIIMLFAFAMCCKFSFAQNLVFGDGSSGALIVNGTQTINSYYEVTAFNPPNTSYTLPRIVVNSASLIVGKKYLIMQMTGANAGNWEVIVPSGLLTANQYLISANFTYNYNVSSTDKVQIIEYNQYTNVTINSTGILTCNPYNAATGTGGVLFFYADGVFTINAGGKCDVNGKGFPANAVGAGATGGAGGNGGTSANIHGGLASIPNTGLNGGGNGGLQMNNAAAGGSSISPNYPGSGTVATNFSTPVTNTSHPNLYLGSCGKSGNGGASGKGAGGGGAGIGGTSCNAGQNGQAGGNGGDGGLGGNGGGIIAVFARTVSITGNNNLQANGDAAINGAQGTTGGNGGNGGDGCGTCVNGGAGGGGNGGNGGNGGDGGSGGAAGFIYIKKQSGTTLNNSICQLLGGSGANGGNGGAGGIAGLNANLIGAVTNCSNHSNGGSGIPTVISPNSTCSLSAVMNALVTIGSGAYTTQNISATVTEYSFNGNTVTIDAVNTNRAIVTAVVNGINYHAVIDITSANVSILSVLQNVLNGNSVNASWNGNDLSFANGDAIANCDLLIIRNTPVDGNAGSSGSNGNSGGSGGFYEDVVPACSNVNLTEYYTYEDCGMGSSNQASTSAAYGATYFFNNQSDPIVGSPNTTSIPGSGADIYTATSSSGCTYTYTAIFLPFLATHNLSVWNITDASCAGNDGSVDYLVGSNGTNGAAAQLYNSNGMFIGYYPGTGTISNLAAGTYTMSTIGCGIATSTNFTIGSPTNCGGSCSTPIISAPANYVCSTGTLALTTSVPNGTWTVSDPTLGDVYNDVFYSYGFAGTVVLTYEVSTGTSTCSATYTVTIHENTLPEISGIHYTCTNSLAIFTNPTSGGSWSWNNPSKGTIIPNGNSVTLQTNSNAGSGNLFYSVTSNGCVFTKDIYVTIEQNVILSGPALVCGNNSIFIMASSNSGTWSLNNPSAGTIFSQYQSMVRFTPANNFEGNVAITFHSNSNGCALDTSKTIVVRLKKYSTTNLTICENQLPYAWNNQAYPAAGSYIAVLTASNGCDSFATLNLTVNQPSFSITNTTICTNQLPYIWNNQSYSSAGSYTIHLNNAAGCDSAATLNLTTNICCVPTSSITTLNICQSQLPYIWNNQSYTSAGSYTVHLNNVAGCDSAATLHLTVSSGPVSQTINLSGCNNVSYNNNSYSQSVSFQETLQNIYGCDSIYRTVNITVNTNPVLQIQIPIDSCASASTSISTSSSYSTYSWTLPNGSIINTASIVGSLAGIYQLTVTNAQGCSASGAFALHYCIPPNIVIAGDSVLCGTEGTREFTASVPGYPTATFEWTDPIGGNSTSNPIVVNNGTTGLYTVVATLPNGATITKTINISSATAITYSVTGQNLCYGATAGSFNVTTTGGTAPYTYSWTNNVTSATNTNEDQLNVPYNQDFYGTITDASGCSTTANLYFQVQSPIAVFVNGTTLACGATSGNVTVSATGGLPFYDASGNPYYLGTGVLNLSLGTHTIFVKDSIGCVTSTTFTVTAPCVCNIPQVSIASDYSQGGVRSGKIYYCYGGALTLTGSLINSATYSWTGPNGFTATTRTIQINPAKPINSGRYTVVASLSPTCFSTGYVDVVVLPQLVVTTSQSISVCPNTSVTLSATASATPVTFYWTYNFASVSPTTFIVTNANQGVYLVKAVDAYGCSGSSSLKVNLLPVPTPVITGATRLCVGSTTQLSAIPTGGVWSSLNNAATISNTGLVTGTFGGGTVPAIIKYTVTNASGCTGFTTYNIVVNPIPGVPSIQYAPGTPNPQTGAGGSFCANRTFTVVGSPAGGVCSRTGVLTVGSSTGIVNTGAVAGTGSLTYTINVNGCTNSRTINGSVTICPVHRATSSNEQVVSSTEFTMYPNPTKSVVSLQVDKLIGSGSIVVNDLYGKQVKTQPLSMGKNTVDIANLAKGFYLVSVITEQEKSTKKLIVE